MSWLSGLIEPVVVSTPQKVRPQPVESNEPKIRRVVRSFRNGAKTTDDVMEMTGLTRGEVSNAIGELKKATPPAIEAMPVTYRLTNPDY